MGEKLKQVPPKWAAAHRRSAGKLLIAESKALRGLLRALRQRVALVVADILALGEAPDTRFVRRRAIRTVRHAIQSLTGDFEFAILSARQYGRAAAYEQLGHELALVRTELHAAEVPQDEHPDDPELADKADEDGAAAHAAATSLAAAWGHRALAVVLKWSDNPNHSLATRVLGTVADMTPRVRVTATTETARAFSDEHDEGVGYIAEQHAGVGWVAALFRLWNALNDRATCARCNRHDGEIVLAGTDFDMHDEPGEVHPSCRCTPSMVFLPIHLKKTTPGEYTGLDDDEAA